VKIRLIDCISPHTADIDMSATFAATETDKIINRCIVAVTDSLRASTKHFTDDQRDHLSKIFFSMRHVHRAIRHMLISEGKDPVVVNVMPLVRVQLETLYAICLIVEDPNSLSLYLKDGWKKFYIQHVLMREESAGLPRMKAELEAHAASIERFRLASGVTIAEKQTIDEEELGIACPPGTVKAHIGQFPTPGAVLTKVREPDRKRMLQRLYFEYQFLCGLVHFSPPSIILSTLLDERQPPYDWSTPRQKYEIFQRELTVPALGFDVLSVVQSCSEFVTIYPSDMNLVNAIADGWRHLTKSWLVGRVVWQIRTMKLLGALS
jgi:hypothetical protein